MTGGKIVTEFSLDQVHAILAVSLLTYPKLWYFCKPYYEESHCHQYSHAQLYAFWQGGTIIDLYCRILATVSYVLTMFYS